MATINTRIQFRRDIAANWAAVANTVIPAAGEPCFETDTGVFKIGDGVKTYGELEAIGGAELSADGKSIIVNGEGVLELAGFADAAENAQPRKKADGTIEWIVPSTDTVDGLQQTVAGLQADLDKLEAIVTPSEEGAIALDERVAAIEEILNPTVEEGEEPAPSLLSRIEGLEGGIATLNGDATVAGSIRKIVTDEIDAFATKVSADGTVNTLKELVDYVADHGAEVTSILGSIDELKGLVGTTAVADQIATAIGASGHILKGDALAIFDKVKYEIVGKLDGTLVDYRDKEIRVMFPADAKWQKQTVGANGDASKYYFGLKIYAPNNNVVSFKEDTAEIIADDTMYYFEGNDFAGIDEFGRKYSIVWLPAAAYDESAKAWTYYGATSSKSKYIGWNYAVEWYDVNGIKVGSDTIRINLSNEACHDVLEPYYAANAIKEVSAAGTLLDIVNNKVDIPVAGTKLGLVKSYVGDEYNKVVVAEDGTMSINKIDVSALYVPEDTELVLDGGSSAVLDGGGAAG